MARNVVIAFLAVALLAATLPARSGDSIYALPAALETQEGKSVSLDVERGHPALVSMFYASCTYVCPTLIANIMQLERTLDPASRARLQVLMVSFDSQNDTPAALTELAAKHHLDLERWTLARASEADVRKIAAVLGIQYRKLPDGSFNHSMSVTLIDGDGAMLAATAQPASPGEGFLAALRSATQP